MAKVLLGHLARMANGEHNILPVEYGQLPTYSWFPMHGKVLPS
jgi:hypothetical protein